MTVPLIKKDNARIDETTADTSSTRNPETEMKPQRPQLVSSDSGKARGPTQRSMDIETAPLFPSNELGELQSRWDRIQTRFVDEPRNAVQQADDLVAAAMQRLADVFASERSKLEQQWGRGDSVSTEDLRVALQRYRSFFHRVLSV
jgi:hypothetical protein